MKKKGTNTPLWSVIMSAPGPLILAIGLMQGRSSTQIADFIRRTIELLAIIASFVAYQITVKRQLDKAQTEKNGKGHQPVCGLCHADRRYHHAVHHLVRPHRKRRLCAVQPDHRLAWCYRQHNFLVPLQAAGKGRGQCDFGGAVQAVPCQIHGGFFVSRWRCFP